MASVPLPAPLLPTGRIAVAAPSSAAPDPAAAAAGLDALRLRGLHVEIPRPGVAAHGFLAGPDADRIGEMNALLARPDLDAIVCLRGGTGALRLLPHLDYAAARQHPKLIVGYSDITALLLALYAKAGLPGLHGPMVAPDWHRIDAASEAQFWTLAGGAAPVELRGPDRECLRSVRPGAAEGVLLGGNLTLVAALCGTPYLPDMTGALLFLEEVGELPYSVDRLMGQLHLAGVLGAIGGLVYGGFTEGEVPPGKPSLSMDEVLDFWAGEVQGPVASGLVYGHFARKSTIPVGVRSRLHVENGGATLTVLDPVTA